MTLNHQFRRAAAVTAGAVIGLAGVVGAGSAAHATTGSLTAVESCSDYNWKIQWKLTTAEASGATGVLSDVKAEITKKDIKGQPGGEPADPKLPALTTLVDGAEIDGDQVVLDEMLLRGSAIHQVKLSLIITWGSGESAHTKELTALANRPTCTPPGAEPTVTPTDGHHPTKPVPTLEPTEGGHPTKPVPTLEPTDGGHPTKPVPTLDPSVTPTATTPGGGAGAGDDNGSGGGALALTGANVWTAAGSAGVLLVVGAVLFVVARRRKPKFTA